MYNLGYTQEPANNFTEAAIMAEQERTAFLDSRMFTHSLTG